MKGKDPEIRLLVAEDDDNFRKVLVEELACSGMSVAGVENGQKALNILEQMEHDVLILDLSMPVLDGMEVLKRLEGRDERPEVIVLTAIGSPSVSMEALQLNAHDFLVKPVKLSDLLETIERAWEKKRSRR